jgi:hypothetical protein
VFPTVIFMQLMVVVLFFATVRQFCSFTSPKFNKIPSVFTRKYSKMASFIPQSTVVDVSQESIDRIVKQTTTWCGLNGLMYTDGKVTWTPAPLSLLPSSFSKRAFEYACRVQPIINKLVDKISRDRVFLLNQLESVSQADDFTKRIIDIYKRVPDEVVQSGLQCGILRSDYMIHHDNNPLQVEINTIASSFGFLSKRVADYHRFILNRNRNRPEMKKIIAATRDDADGAPRNGTSTIEACNVVLNPSSVELAQAIASAHHEFKKSGAVVLFVVQPNERNVRMCLCCTRLFSNCLVSLS